MDPIRHASCLSKNPDSVRAWPPLAQQTLPGQNPRSVPLFGGGFGSPRCKFIRSLRPLRSRLPALVHRRRGRSGAQLVCRASAGPVPGQNPTNGIIYDFVNMVGAAAVRVLLEIPGIGKVDRFPSRDSSTKSPSLVSAGKTSRSPKTHRCRGPVRRFRTHGTPFRRRMFNRLPGCRFMPNSGASNQYMAERSAKIGVVADMSRGEGSTPNTEACLLSFYVDDEIPYSIRCNGYIQVTCLIEVGPRHPRNTFTVFQNVDPGDRGQTAMTTSSPTRPVDDVQTRRNSRQLRRSGNSACRRWGRPGRISTGAD